MPVASVLPEIKRKILLPLPLRLWHLLSLDAPTVAAVWACLLAHAAGVRPSRSALLVLMMGTWLVYAADRLLDARRDADPMLLRERHYFAARHRRRFVVAGIVVGAVVVWLVVIRINSHARIEDAGIFSAAMLYFVAVHAPATNRWLPKELAVAALFAAATAVPAWSQLSFANSQISIRPAALAFATGILAMICWLNCVAIEHWEADASVSTERRVSRTRMQAGQQLSAICYGAAGGALAITPAFLIFARLQPVAPVLLSAAASALLLLGLEQRRQSLSRMQLRIFADLSLLTPLILLGLMKWS